MADILDRLRKAAGDLDAHARHVFGDTQNYASLDNVACYEHEKTCWDAYAEIERLRAEIEAVQAESRYFKRLATAYESCGNTALAGRDRLRAALNSVVKHWRKLPSGPDNSSVRQGNNNGT